MGNRKGQHHMVMMKPFDYEEPAELYMHAAKRTKSIADYCRFSTASPNTELSSAYALISAAYQFSIRGRTPLNPQRTGLGAIFVQSRRQLACRGRDTRGAAAAVQKLEEPLAPFGVARRRVRAIAGRDHARMQEIDVGMVEDDTSPPGPRSLGGLGDQIEIAPSSPKARKRGSSPPKISPLLSWRRS